MASEQSIPAPGKSPQQVVSEFWDSFIVKSPGKVTSIFPRSLYAHLLPLERTKDIAVDHNAAESYETAAAECRKKVQRIVAECHRTNEKFTDPDFDIEGDFGCGDCLHGLPPLDQDTAAEEPKLSVKELKACLDILVAGGVLGIGSTAMLDINAVRRCLGDDGRDGDTSPEPSSVHRVDYIYEKPAFCIDGYSTTDVRQGAVGDCWWVSAVATLCCMEGLMDRVCVARDEECGVYGFVFHRDGEWFSTVVDDNLYLASPDFDSAPYDNTGEIEREYKKFCQTGSRALHFAHCVDKNETWLPLLEKAYAKAHGDYDAIRGGFPGEAVEDMTGGVTTTLATNKVLSREKLWQDLLNANKDFVIAASSLSSYGSDSDAKRGIALGHAYSVLKATEETDEDGKKVRLVMIRNPWGTRNYMGMGEWNGPWCDGSKEWTPYWMQKLNYRFGDDGIFWMSFDDMLRNFSNLQRTRLFDKGWTVTQQWTSVNVSWVTGYLNTKFSVEIKKPGPVVFVLLQLDTRYFIGLEGQYVFDLNFILQEEDAPAGEHIIRASGSDSGSGRSVSAEVQLEPGRYEVLPKILAFKIPGRDAVEDVVQALAANKPQKLRQIGLNYDLAHAKAYSESEDKERVDKAKTEKKKEQPEGKKGELPEGKKEEPPEGEKEEPPEEKKEEPPERKKEEPSEGKQEEPPVERKEGPPEGEKDSSSVAAAPTSADTSTSTSNDPTPASTATPSTASPETKAQASEGPTDKEDASNPPPAPTPSAEAAAEPTQTSPPDSKSAPWNAVCAIGLRVYSKDAEVSIKLVKPRDAEEGAALDVDGVTPAGATM